MADDAGALLVRSGLVTSSALDDARLRVLEKGGTVGEQLVTLGALTDEALTEFYRSRLLVPRVNPNSLAKLPMKVITRIPADLAIELRTIPIALDDGNLTVAMGDPSDRHAVDEIANLTGTYVVRAVATQMQLAWCLAHYYGHLTELGQRLLQADGAKDKPLPAPSPRKKSITEQIKLSRTKRIERGALMVNDVMAELEAATRIKPARSPGDDATTPVDTPRALMPRVESLRPPLGVDDSGPMITIEPAARDSAPEITIEPAPRDSAPEITIEAGEPPPEERTERKLPKPRRKKPAKPDPPELAARAGEVQLATGAAVRAIDFDVPSIMISDDLEHALRPSVAGEIDAPAPPPEPAVSPAPSVTIENEKSEPVLLVNRRPDTTYTDVSAAPVAEIDPDDEISDVIALEVKKPLRRPDGPRRGDRRTVVGIGVIPAATRARTSDGTDPPYDDSPTDSHAAAPPAASDGFADARSNPAGIAESIDDPTRIDAHAAPAGDYTSASDEVIAAPPAPRDDDTQPVRVIPSSINFDRVQARAGTNSDDEDEEADEGRRERPTDVMAAVDLDDVIPGRMSDPLIAGAPPRVVVGGTIETPAYKDPDDGWGPPGSTIPPPLLGAIPGSLEPASGIIPLPDVDSAPLMVAPPSPPEATGPHARAPSEQGLARALEEATARVLDMIHTLDHAAERDQVIAVMIAHLAESHERAGFFAARNNELSLFAIIPRVPAMPVATLRLDRPSTLQDVVGTRLPYRGPMLDEASRLFLQSTLGACPPELLLVPIAVRDRIVGVLFGDGRVRHTFDDQLALAARAAGLALERILKARRA